MATTTASLRMCECTARSRLLMVRQVPFRLKAEATRLYNAIWKPATQSGSFRL
jgi:hypothetical protein